MERYVRFVLRHRALVLGIVGAITVAALSLVAVRASIGTNLGKLFLGDSPDYYEYLDRIRDYATDEVIVVAVEGADPLADSTLDRLEAAQEVILAVADVGEMHSVLDAQRLEAAAGSLRITGFGADARGQPAEGRAELLAELLDDPLSAGLMVGHTGQHVTVFVDLVPDVDRPAENGPQRVIDVQEALVAAGFPRERLHKVGLLVVLAESVGQSRYTIMTIFPWVCLVLLLAVWLLFHRLWPVALSMGVSLVGVAWTMGFAILLDPQISILLAMVPAVTVIVGFSDVIHLCSAYLLELSEGLEREDAIRVSATDVGRACVYTSMTTFVGFVGMSFVPTPAFRQLGIVLGFGVGCALLLAVTLVPIAFSMMPTPKPWRVGATSRVQGVLDAALGGISAVATTRPWAVIAGFAVVLVAAGIGLWDMNVETRFEDRFDEDHPIQVDDRWFREHFAPTNVVHVFVEAPAPGGLTDPALFERLVRLRSAMEADPEVAESQSLVDLVERIHEALNAGDPRAGAWPDSKEALAQYLLLFEMSGGEGLGRVVDFERQTALFSVQVNESGMRGAWEAGERLQVIADRELGGAARAEVSGIRYLFGGWLDEILWGQGKGLIFTFVIISLMMMWGLGSARLGIWSMLPNALPLLVLGGTLGLVYENVDSDTLALAMLAIGIGVDDTIHFLMRFRIESERCDDRAEALERTFDFAGRAIVMTTVTLAAGFAPFALSSYYSTWILGTFLPMTLAVALLADLLLVPALAQVGPLAFGPRGQ